LIFIIKQAGFMACIKSEKRGFSFWTFKGDFMANLHPHEYATDPMNTPLTSARGRSDRHRNRLVMSGETGMRLTKRHRELISEI